MPVFYLTISLCLYVLSLCFDGVLMASGRHMPALQILIYGPWGITLGEYQWFANPLLALAILCHRRFRWLALVCGLAALYLALSSLGVARLPDNHSYDFQNVVGFGAGFYLWLAAIVVFCAGQGWWCWKARNASDVPGWRWLDVALMAAIGVAFYAATQMPSLRFEPHKVMMPPEPQQTL